jgi:hypothetical protein
MNRLLALGIRVMGCPVDRAPAIIERDRMYLAAQPGVIFKYLPLTLPTVADPYNCPGDVRDI